MINIDQLKYYLIRGLPISYKGIKIKQPTLNDLDKTGVLLFSHYKFLFVAKKEHLGLDDEIIELTKKSSFFETIFIRDIYLANKNVDNRDSYIALLRMSLAFFLDIDVNSTKVDIENYSIKIPLEDNNFFELNKKNFDEFSEIIRLICYSEMLEVDTGKPKYKLKHYDNLEMRKLLEDSVRRYEEEEKKKQKENATTIADIIGAICVNDKTKYRYDNIGTLTIWQLHHLFYSMFKKENIEVIKAQFTSGNFKFDKVPDLDWLKKVKVKLPKDCKLGKQ